MEQGDLQGAADALARAARVDANEPLAWFNLANVMLLRGDAAQARTMYERAVAIEPSLAPAELQLARLSLLNGDSVAALAHLRRGLAFDTADAETRAFAAALERRFAPPARRTP
jgi:tetratricopeptide (TPR) repeat protein